MQQFNVNKTLAEIALLDFMIDITKLKYVLPVFRGGGHKHCSNYI